MTFPQKGFSLEVQLQKKNMGMVCLQVSLGSLSAGMVARWLPGSFKYYCHYVT